MISICHHHLLIAGQIGCTAQTLHEWVKKDNICPTQTIDTVVERDAKRDLVPKRWGLVPLWWKKTAKETPSTFNARAETVAEKPMFRSAFKRNRCLIPASGYYEWQSTPTGKQPYYYTARDGSPLTMAGLWDEWIKMILINSRRRGRTVSDAHSSHLENVRCDGHLRAQVLLSGCTMLEFLRYSALFHIELVLLFDPICFLFFFFHSR